MNTIDPPSHLIRKPILARSAEAILLPFTVPIQDNPSESRTMNASNCTTVGEVKPIIIMYSVISVAATFFYGTSIGIIVKTKAYKQTIHRLSLYLAIGGLLRTMTIWIAAAPIDIQQPDDSPVSVRDGWSGLCSFSGYLNQYTGFLQTFTVVWIAIYIFFAVVYLKQLTQRKYELAGLATILLAPLLLTWEPFIMDSYGISQTMCWIAVPSCNDSHILYIYLLAIATIPQIVLTQFGFLMMSIAIFHILRKICLKLYEHHYRLAMKEILPLMLYPLIYSLVFFGRMIGVLTGSDPSLVGSITVALILTCSVFIPVSLLLRPGVRHSFCHASAQYEDEELTSGLLKSRT